MNSGTRYIPVLVERIKQVNPYKIILFGSYAAGTPNTDSDIDLLIVTSDTFIPENYDEKMELALKISHLISDIRSKQPVDLIVHTLPMHKKFIEYGSQFSKEILTNGKVLYERDNKGLA
jgi:predicted nucleotidyltransferase